MNGMSKKGKIIKINDSNCNKNVTTITVTTEKSTTTKQNKKFFETFYSL